MIKIKTIKAIDTYPVRKVVLREGIPLPFIFSGDDDEDTIHIGAYLNENLIAVSSFMKAENKQFEGSQYQLRGMATLTEFQGLGAGKLMLEFAVELMKSIKVRCIWCNARVIAVPFYKKQGFRIIGDKFDIEHVGDHFVMYKYLQYDF